MVMKIIQLIVAVLVVVNTIDGQEESSRIRRIEVIGYAESEVVPDEIFYTIELKEYKIGRDIIKIDELEKKFSAILNKYEIEKGQISQGGNTSRKYRIKRKKEEVLKTKYYTIKFSGIEELNNFAKDVEQIPIEQGYISNVDHSMFSELEESVKISAIKNAKSRATKLLGAIDSKIGKVLEVSEVLENDYKNYLIRNYYNAQNYMKKLESGMMSPMSLDDIEIKKLKLTTTIRVVFEIE